MRLPSGSRSLVVVVIVLALAFGVTTVDAQQWLSEMPEPELVIQDIQGSDALDTAAQQYSALFFLSGLVRDVFIGEQMPAAASAKLQGYGRAAASVYERMHFDPNCKMPDCPIRQYGKLVSRYDHNPQFEEKIRSRYFSRQWRNEYAEALRRSTQQGRQTRTPSPQSPVPQGASRQEALAMSAMFGVVCAFGILGWITAKRRLRGLAQDAMSEGVTFDGIDPYIRRERQKSFWVIVRVFSFIVVPLSGLIALAAGLTFLTRD